MACPKCGCKVHYQYDTGWDEPQDSQRERCSACSHVFYAEDAADDDDDHEESSTATSGVRANSETTPETRNEGEKT